MRMGWKIDCYPMIGESNKLGYQAYNDGLCEKSTNYATRSQARNFIKRWIETYNLKHGIIGSMRAKQFNPVITVRHIDGSITRVAA